MIDAKITGLPDLRRELSQIVPKLRVRALRTALAAGARLVRDAARRAAPIISAGALAVRRGVRKPGTLRKAISVRTSRAARRRGDVGVFVNVKPLPAARYRGKTTKVLGITRRSRVLVRASTRGANNPSDPYYWRFVNFGTRKGGRAYAFLERGAAQLQQALEVFKARLPAIIAKLNRPKAPPP